MGKNRNRTSAVAVTAALVAAAAAADAPQDEVLATDDNVQLVGQVSELPRPKSIRQLVLNGLLNGVPRQVMAVQLAEYFPNNRAAVIPVKHIAWYAGRLKKELAAKGQGLPVPRAITPAEAEAIAALKASRAATTEDAATA